MTDSPKPLCGRESETGLDPDGKPFRCRLESGHAGWHIDRHFRWTEDFAVNGANPLGNLLDPNEINDLVDDRPDPHPKVAWICIACGHKHRSDHEGLWLGSFMACVSCEKTVQERMLSREAQGVRHGCLRRVDLPLATCVELQIVGELHARGYLQRVDPADLELWLAQERRAKGLEDDGLEHDTAGMRSPDYGLGFKDALESADRSRTDMIRFYENALNAERATTEEVRQELAVLKARMASAEAVARAAAVDPDPIPMRLTCPECNALHIDEGDFKTKRHHTHACQNCGNVWRPAVVATVGVRFLPGFKDGAGLGIGPVGGGNS